MDLIRASPRIDRASTSKIDRAGTCVSTASRRFRPEFIGFVRITTDDGATGLGQVSTYNSDITVDGAAPPGGAMGARRRVRRYRRAHRQGHRARAQIPRLVHEAGAGRARHGDLGLPGQAGRPAGRRAARRHAGPAAGLCLLDEARHHAARRKPSVSSGCRANSVSMPSSSASPPNTATTSTNGRAAPKRSCRRSARRLATWASLLVDANSGFSPARAIEVGRLLADNGIEHFEEPCLYWELEQTKAGGRRTGHRRDRRRAGLRDRRPGGA